MAETKHEGAEMHSRAAMLAAIAAAVMAAAPGRALAAQVDFFLKIDGIPGASLEDKHKDWIELSSWSFGVAHPSAGGSSTSMSLIGRPNSGPLTRQVSQSELSITKVHDQASALLAQAAQTRRRFPQVILEVRKAGGEQQQQVYMRYQLTNAFISSFQPAGGSPGAQEKIEFVYAGMTAQSVNEGKTGPTGLTQPLGIARKP